MLMRSSWRLTCVRAKSLRDTGTSSMDQMQFPPEYGRALQTTVTRAI
jgi:hypothetical protein